MAMPSPGKCFILLVLVLALYTSYAFRIRDAVPSSSVDHSRTVVCSGTGNARCVGDESQTGTSSSWSLPGGIRKRHDAVGSDGVRGRISGKMSIIRQSSVVVGATEDASLHDDNDDHAVKNSLPSISRKFDKWTGSESRIKFSRLAAKFKKDEKKSEDDYTEEDKDENDDGDEIKTDEEDDGVEIVNDDEGAEEDSVEFIDADDDDDAGDDDEDDKTEEITNEDDDADKKEDDEENASDGKMESNNDDLEEDSNDVEPEELLPKPSEKMTASKLGDLKSPPRKRDKDDDKTLANENFKESGDRKSTKTTVGKKITAMEADSDDEVQESKEDDRSKQQRQVITEGRQTKVDEESMRKVTKKTNVEESGEDDDDDADDDENDEDDEEIDEKEAISASMSSSPTKKFEKVRLADKEKSKSIEAIQATKHTVIEPEKLVKVKPSATSPDETRLKKKKVVEAEAPSTKFETEKSTIITRPETNPKTNVSAKSSRNETSSVKSDATRKSAITKDGTKPKAENDTVVVRKNKNGVTVPDGTTKKAGRSSDQLQTGVKKSGKKINGDQGGKDKKSSSESKKRTDAALSLTQLNDAILRAPTFVPNFTAIEDPACQQHGKIFLRQLRGYKLWALQMLDSSAKIPSGLLRGNINQFGDFDQCLGVTARVKVDEKTVKVQGKYCLATMDIHATIPDMKIPVNFMQSRGFIRASIRDPGHFAPRFTIGNWAICIPAACSAKDAQNAIENTLSSVNISSGLRFSVDVDPEMCYVRQKSQAYTKETIGVLYFYAMIICIVLVATIRDYIVNPQGKGNYSERIIMSFSLRRTWEILTRGENTKSVEISCIHGIRSLATMALYVAHKIIPTSQIPYANRISLTEIANNPTSSLLRTSVAYTDCFLLLSGLLTAFNMARETTRRGEIRWFCRFVARFIRLTPALLVMVFWYAYVMEHVGSGPQWYRIITTNAELCKQNSWTNLLYIQNFFPFEEMCATHTHQLALDMQLSLIAPILVFFLTLKPIIGILVMFFILQVSATFRYFATTGNNLSLVIYHGITTKQLYKTANLTYSLPLHRATPYVFGVGLGVLLHYTGKNVRIYRIFVIFGWSLAMFLGIWSLFSPWRQAKRDYVYDVEEAAHYAVIAPVAWSLTLSWIIFACFTNHGGFVNKFLTSYWMILFSRISYAVYLCQFAVFFYNVGTARYSSGLELQRFIDPCEALVVILVSVVLTLLIDIPMQEVKNVIMESSDGLTSTIIEKKIKNDGEEASTPREALIPVVDGQNAIKRDEQEVGVRSGSWNRHDDALDGLTNLEDPEDKEYMEKWRPRLRSNHQGRFYDRRETREMDDDPRDEEEMDEEEAEQEDLEDRPTEWSWVKKTRNTIPVDDDGLLEHRRSRSSQRDYYVESEKENRSSSRHRRHQRDEGTRSERRSLSAKRDRSLGRTESPRSSVKRERSTSRAADPRAGHHVGSRGGSVGREERTTELSREASRREISPKRERTRVSESRVMEIADSREYSRPSSRASLPGREKDRTVSRESLRHERSPSRAPVTVIREPLRLLSSGSDEEPSRHQQTQRPIKTARKQQPIEPKISDEEDWEEELRIRRRKFMERLASEDRDTRIDEGNDGWNSVKRRSSAEGKLALLKDPTGSNVMDSWTVSRGPRVSLLGSSQETEDDTSGPQVRMGDRTIQRETSIKEDDRSDESSQERSGRRSYTSGSQVTSLEEEEDLAGNEFVLNKDSKRITVMDLSTLSQEDFSEGSSAARISNEEEDRDEEQRPIMATLKLFKRESIVKSQASEEDPEYLLPERPKLMEQEQDHPFKKAWQLQKSRSEEDPAPYALKDVKIQQETSRSRVKATGDKVDKDIEMSESKEESGGPRLILDCSQDVGAEVVWHIGHSENGNGSSTLESYQDNDADVNWLGGRTDLEDGRSSSKSTTDDSCNLESLSDDDKFDIDDFRQRRQSDEVNYEWEPEET